MRFILHELLERMHTCTTCTRTFSRQRALEYHTNKRHNLCSNPSHYCNSCNKAISSYSSLLRHKQRCGGIIPHEPTEINTRDAPIAGKFITTEEFNRLAYGDPISWTDLSHDCIYQLQRVIPYIQDLFGVLAEADGCIVSALLPSFAIEKLVSISMDELSGSRIFLRKRGEDNVDIVTL